MSKYISGIQQLGIGVADARMAFHWYCKNFGVDTPMFEESATASLMLPYTGGKPRNRLAILALNLQGGGGMEIWQYTCRQPEMPAFDPQLGDLGIFIGKIKCKDVQACYSTFESTGITIDTPVETCPDGRLHFYMRDPWNNRFEVVESDDWLNRKLKSSTGGIYGATIGVSNMDASIRFYSNILGYDQVAYDTTAVFPDWSGLPGADQPFRRVLLRHNKQRPGPFGRLLGPSEIELVQALEYQPRAIYADRFWGDLGFIHLCIDVVSMADIKDLCQQNGSAFVVDSSGSFDMGEANGHFSYIEDPDGTLIEFVETHRIPIIKKIGWYIDLRKRRNRFKALPDFIWRALHLTRVRS